MSVEEEEQQERIVLQDKSSMNCLVSEERNRKLNHQIEEVVASDVVAITSNPKLQLPKTKKKRGCNLRNQGCSLLSTSYNPLKKVQVIISNF